MAVGAVVGLDVVADEKKKEREGDAFYIKLC